MLQIFSPFYHLLLCLFCIFLNQNTFGFVLLNLISFNGVYILYLSQKGFLHQRFFSHILFHYKMWVFDTSGIYLRVKVGVGIQTYFFQMVVFHLEMHPFPTDLKYRFCHLLIPRCISDVSAPFLCLITCLTGCPSLGIMQGAPSCT